MSQPRLERAIVRDDGIFTVEELRELMPAELVKGLANPAPARPRNG